MIALVDSQRHLQRNESVPSCAEACAQHTDRVQCDSRSPISFAPNLRILDCASSETGRPAASTNRWVVQSQITLQHRGTVIGSTSGQSSQGLPPTATSTNLYKRGFAAVIPVHSPAPPPMPADRSTRTITTGTTDSADQIGAGLRSQRCPACHSLEAPRPRRGRGGGSHLGVGQQFGVAADLAQVLQGGHRLRQEALVQQGHRLHGAVHRRVCRSRARRPSTPQPRAPTDPSWCSCVRC